MNKITKTLEYFATILNKNEITWALGGSFLLHFKGIQTEVNDIDILIDESDYIKLLDVLKKFPYQYLKHNEKYSTTHFFSLTISDIHFDLMLGFKVKTSEGTYIFPFNQDLREKITSKNNVDIYLSSLDEWYNAYRAMNRIDKILLLEEYYEKNNS